MRTRMAKVSEMGKLWKAELTTELYFFPGEICYFWAWVGSRKWGLCPGRGLPLREGKTFRTFGGPRKGSEKKVVTQEIAKHSLYSTRLLSSKRECSGRLRKRKREVKNFWKVALKKQRLAFKNCWDNELGGHTRYSVGSCARPHPRESRPLEVDWVLLKLQSSLKADWFFVG